MEMRSVPVVPRSSLAGLGAAGDHHERMREPAAPVQSGLRIAVVSNTAWNLFNFRLNLMRKLRADGHLVIAVAPPDRYVARIEAAGFEFEPVAISVGGVNPVTESRSVFQLWRMLRRRDIDLVLSYTPKGNLYSALASIAARNDFVPNVSGLGRAFIRRSPVTWAALLLYRLTFPRARRVFFQNLDDLDLFVRARLVSSDKAERLPGSGVDLARFEATPLVSDRSTRAPVFLLIARMLWDKGVGEYVAAARQVKAVCPEATFRLLGDVDSQNPAAIPAQQVADWVREGIVTYHGSTDDVRPYIADADCVVLPSYREGVPRVLLEAAAMGRPVITTDAPGCRDAVLHGETGFVCRARDAQDLAATLQAFIVFSPAERQRMAERGRAFVERQFSEDSVIDRYRHVVNAYLSGIGISAHTTSGPLDSIHEPLTRAAERS
jgi:glycosyltransferase involved in cell wall biosynthesis